MKKFIILMAFFTSLEAYCQDDYVININDSTFNVSLDKQYSVLINGTKYNFKINQKDTLTHIDKLFSFNYPKGVKVSTTTIDEAIEQIVILTAEGSGLIIQQYESINPTSLNELMLNEMTKESISYGFEAKKTTYKKILKSGQEIEITKAVLTYKEEVNIYEITSLGTKDSGIIIVTIKMSDNENLQAQNIIDLMWKSIKVNW